jgi:hypothetical protein
MPDDKVAPSSESADARDRQIKFLTIGRYTALALGLLAANFGKELHLPSPWTWLFFLVIWMFCFGRIWFLRRR